MKLTPAILVTIGLGLVMSTVAAFAEEQESGASSQAASVQQTPTAPSPQTSEPPKRKIERSMVGYIDDAIIGSRVRIRAEAGWNAQFPDRAEYFYAKCGCYRSLVGTGLPAADPTAPGPQGGVATNLNFQQLYFEGEYAPSPRFSFFAEAPVRWLQPTSFVPGTGSFGNQGGFGDLRAGVKASVLNKESTVVTIQLKSYFQTGDASKGLGVNHYSIEPAVLYYQQIGSRAAIESQFSYWHPIGGSPGVATASNPNPGSFAGDVLSYGIGPSVEVYRGDRVRFGPVVELVGWRVLDGFETVWVSANQIGQDVSGTNIVNLKAGVRATIDTRNSIYIGYGHALTNAVWYTALVRAEYRFSF